MSRLRWIPMLTVASAALAGCTTSEVPVDGSETTAVTDADAEDTGEPDQASEEDANHPRPVCDFSPGDDEPEPEPDPFAQLETDAAVDDLQLIVDAAFAFFLAEHPPGEGDPVDWPLHRCPTAWGQSTYASGITPDIALNCNDGPDRRCVPVGEGGGGLGQYTVDLWLQNFAWAGLGFAKLEPHAFHYEFVATSATEGYGACTFTARAHADLDDDLVFSTYERRGSADENGVVEDPTLYVVLAWE